MSLEKRLKDDILGGYKPQEERCKQCKNCQLNNDGTPYSNDYHKTCCIVYPYPQIKPEYVRDNSGICEFKV